MQTFQTTILSRGKQVEIRGTISRTQQEYAAFLKNYQQCSNDFLKQIYAKLQYSGDQLLISLIFFIAFAVSQVYNLFTYSQNVSYQISITGCLFYSLLFMSLLNFKRNVLIQLILLLLSCGFIVFSRLTTFIDTYNAAGIVFCIFCCFLAKLVNYFYEKHYAEDATPKFSFQSNLLLFKFLAWKAYQISLYYANINTFNFDSLLPTLMALAVINSIKIYTLFDFEVFQVINIFKQRYEHSQNEDIKNMEPVQHTVNVWVKNKQIDGNQGDTEKPLKKQELNDERGEAVQEESVYKICQKTAGASQKYQHHTVLENYQKTFKSKWRIAAFLIFIAANLAFIMYIIIQKQSATNDFKSNLLWYSASFLRTTLLLVSCEYQKVIRGQIKDLLNYFLLFWSDLIWIVFSALIMLLPSLLSLQNQESFMLSMIPLATIKILNYLDKSAHQKLTNAVYVSMVLCLFIPLSFRQLGYTLNNTVIIYVLDIIAASYAVFILLVWSNKDSFISLMKTVKNVLFSKKDRRNIFQKLKTTKFQYSQIIQLYVFLHAIYLNCVYFYTLSNMSQFIKIIYLINYFSPMLLYLLALINSHHYSQSIPQKYKPSLSNFLILLGSVIYIIISYNGLLSASHLTWSLIVFLNICLFVLALEGQKLAIVYFPAYCNFLRVMVITVLFFFIYFPFIIGFVSGYLITDFSEDYLYYYSLFGFFYIWIIITIVGMAMHWILNLTQKAKKELFIARYMQGEMKKINLKEDIQKILMISNMFEVYNYKSEDLLFYLKSQQHLAIVVRKEKEYEYDYQLVEPEQKQKKRLSIIAKPIITFDIGQLVAPRILNLKSDIQEGKQNPVLMFFKQKENHKIEVSPHQDTNANIIQLRRMITRKKYIHSDQKQYQKTQSYKVMVSASEEALAEYMSNLYTFLTKPSKLVARQTFYAFLTLLTRENQTLQQSNKIYSKFSPNGLMDEYKFKSFILDYVNFKYEMAHDTLSSKLRTFCCKQIVPLFSANSELFKHSIIRKKEQSNLQSIEAWLTDKVIEENNFEFNALRKRQLKKKAKLLKKTLHKKKVGNKEEEAEQQAQNNQEVQETIHKRNPTLLKADKKELKDKKFMKSQNIYAVLVNSLIECNLYYQKEAQNFKIKTIKFTISNLLAILTKLNDIVFVFGYSTIYLFIAYYKSNFGDTYPIYNSISYYILLIASGSLVLVYILLIVYHKSDFEKGTLGLDQNQRSLDFKNIKFYTTTVLFLLGSALSNYIMAIGLNSYICNTTTNKLYNFSEQSCYNTYQYGYMLASLFILVIYWPLSTITFPFSTVMNRDLEIKYKAQYQILYLQFKFLINGLNTLLNPYQYQTEQLINSISKVVICSLLALLYSKMQPCSYQLLNRIQGKVYIILALLSFAGALCYVVGLFYSIIITGSILGLYLVYFIYTTIKNYSQLKNDNQQDEILEDNIKNQKLKIEIIKQTNPQELQKELISMQSIKGKSKQVQVVSHTINTSQGQNLSKTERQSAKRMGYF